MAPMTANLGPLSQVELPLQHLKTAVYLATGPHGWHKTQERLHTLEQLLFVSGAQLEAPSSFDFAAYREERSINDMVYGVIVQNGFVESVPLPNASTGLPDDAGQACLRALTCGLLCFYGADTTVNLLRELIPHALLSPGHGDTELRIQHELLDALQRWVESVMLEEDANDFRQHLLDEAGEFEASVTGIPPESLRAMDRIHINDVPLILGALKWILWPKQNRQPQHYPTSSLKVLTMSHILSKLGFDVKVSTSVVSTTEDYMIATLGTGTTAAAAAAPPDIFLIGNRNAETDFLATFNEHLFRGRFEPKWQTTVLEAIPWLTFKHFRGKTPGIDTRRLVDAWNAAFAHVRQRVDRLVRQKGQVCLLLKPDASPAEPPVPETHRAILHYFSPHLHRLCGAVMRDYGPASATDPGWALQDISEGLRALAGGHSGFVARRSGGSFPDARVKDHCHVVLAIVMGTVYGLASASCLEHSRPLGAGGEVVFQPDAVLADGRLRAWARVVGAATGTAGVAQGEWSGLVFELFLGARDALSTAAGAKHGASTATSTRRDSVTGATTVSTAASSAFQQQQHLVLAAQANGLSAVANALVNMAVGDSALHFHIRRGVLLNLPPSGEGADGGGSGGGAGGTRYVRTSTRLEPAAPLSLLAASTQQSVPPNEEEEEEADGAAEPSSPGDVLTSLSVTVTPCWEGDPTSIVYRITVSSGAGGASAAATATTANIALVLAIAATSTVPCAHETPTTSSFSTAPPSSSSAYVDANHSIATLLRERRWRFVHFGQLIRGGRGGGDAAVLGARRRGDVDAGGKAGGAEAAQQVILDASWSPAATVYALGAVKCRNLFVSAGCLGCVYGRWRRRMEREGGSEAERGSVVVVLPWREGR